MLPVLLIIQNSWIQLLQVNNWQETIPLCDLNWQPASNRPKQTSREKTTRAYGWGKCQTCPSGNTNHHWRFEPSVRQRHHLPSPPLQAQATITREDHPGLWAEQAPTMLHQSPLKTRTFCRTMQPSCVLTTNTTISPLLQSQAQECKYHSVTPKDSNLSPGNGIQPVPSQAKDLTPHPTPLPFQLQAQSNVTLTPTSISRGGCM